jgi:CDP-glycerol glycerophosphotransferase (TagB/SpsB family)
LYESGDYFKLFAGSTALITDSGSFLAEYLPTQKPVLVLESESSVGYNEMGQKIVDAYYHAKTAQEVRSFISENIELHIDPKRKDRERIARELGLAHLPAAAITILEDILHEFNQ